MLVKNKLKKLKKIDSSYFRGKSYFEDDCTQNYLVFQPMHKYFKNIGNTDNISEWKSRGLYNEVIKPPDNALAPELIYSGKRVYVKFNGSCLKQDKIRFNHGKILNIYIVCALKSTLNNDQDIILEKCLFGAVKLTKNTDISKYKYFGYGIGLDGKGAFSHPSGGFGNNAIIFGVDMWSSKHVNDKKKMC